MKRALRVLAWLALLTASAPEVRAQWSDLSVPSRPVLGSDDVEAGRTIYEERCWFCHGTEGDGNGPIAEYLWPRPRDFTFGLFKLRSTESGELPLDEDLYRTVTLGMPGTAMPAWQSVLTPRQRWQVIGYLKTFAGDLFGAEEFDPYERIVQLSPPPRAPVEELVAAGREVYREASCWECHGDAARGEGTRAGELDDDLGLPTLPNNLHSDLEFKGGRAAADIWLRFSTGLDGTPMPSYAETLTPEERWQLAYYVESLQENVASVSADEAVIPAAYLEGLLPASVSDSAWELVPRARVPLTGQATHAPRWQVPAVRYVTVRAVFNDDELAMLLTWSDRFRDTLAPDSAAAIEQGWSAGDTYVRMYPDLRRVRGRFPDALEVLFPVSYVAQAELPHFLYGSSGRPVELWSWRADRRPAGDAAVVTMSAAGVAGPPEPLGPEQQHVTGGAVFSDGQWSLLLRRSLRSPDGRGVQLEEDHLIPVAFHVREGSHGETGLRMAVSSWYYLSLSRPPPPTTYARVLLVVVVAVALEVALAALVGSLADRGRLRKFGITE